MATLTKWIQAPLNGGWDEWKPRFDNWMNELRYHVQTLLDSVATIIGWSTTQTYTPTFTQSTTISKTVDYADYKVIGGWVVGEVHMTATGVTSGTGGNVVVSSVPVAPIRTQNRPIAFGWFIDASSGILYNVIGYRSGTTEITFVRTANESTSPYLGLSGFTAAVTTNDVLSFSFRYRSS